MRSLILFVSSAVLLTGGFNLALAQHSGGHSSGGHFSSSSSGSRSFSHTVYPTYPTPIGLQHQFSGYTGINGGALRTNPVRVGVGRRPIYGGGYYSYYPYFPLFNEYDDAGYGYNSQWQSYPPAPAPDPSVTLLGQQVDRLSAEVEALRNERDQQEEVPPALMPRPRYNAPPMMPADETPSSVPVTLILRDGKQLHVNSYAVMGKEVWDFTSQPVKKIPVANIDLEASEKATEAAGGEFPAIP